MSLIQIENLTHGFGEKKLFANAAFRLLPGDRMGLTGPNGSGKSTLINILTGKILPDAGTVEVLPGVSLGCLDQHAEMNPALTVEAYLRTAFAGLYEAERRLMAVHASMGSCTGAELERLNRAASALQQRLEQGGFYALDSTIARVAAGLGVAAMGMDTPTGNLSGGQRAKVMLAKLLLEAPDVLLLDEPTNFLDRRHIDWLVRFLKRFGGAYAVVSHDPAFLRSVTNCVCDIEFFSITRYTGDFGSFESQKAQKKEEYARNWGRQREEIEKLEEYIAKNLARASTSNMAKSRRKKLMKIERMEKPQALPVPRFAFAYKPVNAQVLLHVQTLCVGYDRPLLRGIDLKVRQGETVAVKGFNGVGKTTLLKTIAGRLPALGGSCVFADRCAVGYYEQDFAWEDPARPALQEIVSAYPRVSVRDARSWLARCGLRQEHADRAVGSLSGGEQAKVKLCLLMMTPHSLLLLDEPTNHLDANARSALREVLKGFSGGVVLVSHEDAFHEGVADRVLNVEEMACN